MKKGYLKIAGTILAATLLFTGCAQTGSQSSVISGNDTKILMCMSDGNDTFRAMLADAAASTAQNLGAQFDLVDAQNTIEHRQTRFVLPRNRVMTLFSVFL